MANPIKKGAKEATEKKTWTKDEIAINLKENDEWVKRGIVAVFKRQTADEQESEFTKHENGVGFNKFDSGFLSSLAKQIIKRGSLTKNQIKAGRKAMMKYAGQLTKIANGEA